VKTEGEIRHKLKQVIYRHRKDFVKRGLARMPENCEHNRVVRLPVHTGNRATIRVCGYEKDGEGNDVVCDASMAGEVQAEKCPYFCCRHDADGLKSRFKSKMGLDGTVVQIGLIAKEYPDVAALMWALGPRDKQNKRSPAEDSSPGILAFFGDPKDEPVVVPEQPLLEDTE
jgi:hypothetical protein